MPEEKRSIERVPLPEKAPDQPVEAEKEKIKKLKEKEELAKKAEVKPGPEPKLTPIVEPSSVAKPSAPEKSPLQKSIELVLQEDLQTIFTDMPTESKKAFQQKGRETARKLEIALSKSKIKAGEILDLIKDWLKLIPGVNRLFLEQEAKIKADKLLHLKNVDHNH